MPGLRSYNGDIIKGDGGFLYALLASLLLHAGIFLALFSVSTDEILRGDILFIRLITHTGVTGKDNSAVGTFVSPAFRKKELFQNQRESEIAIRDRHRGSETLLNELKTEAEENLDSPQTLPEGSPDRTISSHAAIVTGSEEKTTLPQSSLRGDDIGLSKEALYGLISSEGPSILELIRPLYPPLARRLAKKR